jgi:hypothetical protein
MAVVKNFQGEVGALALVLFNSLRKAQIDYQLHQELELYRADCDKTFSKIVVLGIRKLNKKYRRDIQPEAVSFLFYELQQALSQIKSQHAGPKGLDFSDSQWLVIFKKFPELMREASPKWLNEFAEKNYAICPMTVHHMLVDRRLSKIMGVNKENFNKHVEAKSAFDTLVEAIPNSGLFKHKKNREEECTKNVLSKLLNNQLTPTDVPILFYIYNNSTLLNMFQENYKSSGRSGKWFGWKSRTTQRKHNEITNKLAEAIQRLSRASSISTATPVQT